MSMHYKAGLDAKYIRWKLIAWFISAAPLVTAFNEIKISLNDHCFCHTRCLLYYIPLTFHCTWTEKVALLSFATKHSPLLSALDSDTSVFFSSLKNHLTYSMYSLIFIQSLNLSAHFLPLPTPPSPPHSGSLGVGGHPELLWTGLVCWLVEVEPPSLKPLQERLYKSVQFAHRLQWRNLAIYSQTGSINQAINMKTDNRRRCKLARSSAIK